MTVNRITPAGAIALLCAAAFALAGCGGGDSSSAPDPVDVKAADAAILNDVLSRQLAAVDAYATTIPRLPAPAAELARRFRAQEQEHAVAIVKALRGLGEESEPDPEPVEPEGLRTTAELLAFLYELEGATIDYELNAISELGEPWPRALLGAIVANQSQHRYVLRRLLGARGEEAIPEAFEDGTETPPGEEED